MLRSLRNDDSANYRNEGNDDYRAKLREITKECFEKPQKLPKEKSVTHRHFCFYSIHNRIVYNLFNNIHGQHAELLLSAPLLRNELFIPIPNRCLATGIIYHPLTAVF